MMGGINVVRVILGGLLAGLVLNLGEFLLNEVVLVEQWTAFAAELGLGEIGTSEIASFVGLSFVQGVVLVWLYAAIRPRFGAGVKTAITAGVAMWVFAWLLPNAFLTIAGLYPLSMALIGTPWGLVEVPLAAVAGAWLYTESA